MHANEQLLHDFYAAFERLDAATMGRSYAPDAHFSDPAFPDLNGPQVPAMWAMLCGRSTGLRLEVSDIHADDRAGSAKWVAHYKFGAEQRDVVNHVSSAFVFADGLIRRQKDTFDFHAWSAQALGLKGRLLGWTPIVRNAAQKTAAAGLAAFMARGAQAGASEEAAAGDAAGDDDANRRSAEDRRQLIDLTRRDKGHPERRRSIGKDRRARDADAAAAAAEETPPAQG